VYDFLVFRFSCVKSVVNLYIILGLVVVLFAIVVVVVIITVPAAVK